MAIDYSRQLAAKTGYTFVFLETSAKTGLNIQIAFDIITNKLLKKFNIDINLDLPEGIELISPGEGGASGGGSGDNQKEIEELNNRIKALEDKFAKLAQIVKNLVDKS